MGCGRCDYYTVDYSLMVCSLWSHDVLEVPCLAASRVMIHES